MGTVVVSGILILIIVAIIRSMIKNKKEGKSSCSCGGSCSSCGVCSCGDEKRD